MHRRHKGGGFRMLPPIHSQAHMQVVDEGAGNRRLPTRIMPARRSAHIMSEKLAMIAQFRGSRRVNDGTIL